MQNIVQGGLLWSHCASIHRSKPQQQLGNPELIEISILESSSGVASFEKEKRSL